MRRSAFHFLSRTSGRRNFFWKKKLEAQNDDLQTLDKVSFLTTSLKNFNWSIDEEDKTEKNVSCIFDISREVTAVICTKYNENNQLQIDNVRNVSIFVYVLLILSSLSITA